MSIEDAELAKARADLLLLEAKQEELSAAFLKNVTKLGSVCSAFGIDAGLEGQHFVAAVNERRLEIRRAGVRL